MTGRPAWEARVAQFVDQRSEAARAAGRSPEPDQRDTGAAHRALAEGAWYVLELARQHPEHTAAALRRTGAHLLDRWRGSADPFDRDRWAAADWALWLYEGSQGGWWVRIRRARSRGPVPGRGGT